MNWIKKGLKILATTVIIIVVLLNLLYAIRTHNEYGFYEDIIEEEVIKQNQCVYTKNEYIKAKNKLLLYSYRYIAFRDENKFLSKYTPVKSDIVMTEILKTKMFYALIEEGEEIYLKEQE
ncbi:MAG: hypothetical protein PHZ26_01040 [Candidatus Gracilibacteria bacterium]|nr:hypothetical protein [Candidatus Gracilibacteria bacterium]MDD2908320.1 hypothetical protein [Candidatus Gracilibacteria bacterium]